MDLPKIASRVAILFGGKHFGVYHIGVTFRDPIWRDDNELKKKVKQIMGNAGFPMGDMELIDSYSKQSQFYRQFEIMIDPKFGELLEEQNELEFEEDGVVISARFA